MALITDSAFDAALSYITTNGAAAGALHILSAEPTAYGDIATYDLGNATPTYTGPSNGDASGRKVQVDAVSSGSVTADGTASHVAIVYAGNSEILIWQTLSSSQVVTNGNTFSLTAFDIEFPDPA